MVGEFSEHEFYLTSVINYQVRNAVFLPCLKFKLEDFMARYGYVQEKCVHRGLSRTDHEDI